MSIIVQEKENFNFENAKEQLKFSIEGIITIERVLSTS